MLQTERLRQLRKALYQNQAALAESLNITREAYSMYENGHRQPSNETLADLSRHLQASSDYLLGLTNIQQPLHDFSDEDLDIIHTLPHINVEVKEAICVLLNHISPVEVPSSAAILSGSSSKGETKKKTIAKNNAK